MIHIHSLDSFLHLNCFFFYSSASESSAKDTTFPAENHQSLGLAGHDFGLNGLGVIRAVSEFALRHNATIRVQTET